MSDVVIAGAVRTPIGKFQGSLSCLRAPDLGAVVLREALSRCDLEGARVDEVIMGCVLPAGLGQNPARQAAIAGGIPADVGALTLNMVCGSGLRSVTLAASMIQCGERSVVLAGGMESMTNAPYIVPGARSGLRMGHASLVDVMIRDGLWDVYSDSHMGLLAESVAETYDITKEEQDKFAYDSHRKAVYAQEQGFFESELVPVRVPDERHRPATFFETDEGPRSDTSYEKIAGLPPAFRKNGIVTVGNVSQISDGASAMVVLSRQAAEELDVRPLARITGYVCVAVEPKWYTMAPVKAVQLLVDRIGKSVGDIDLFEINEAFAVQALAVARELGITPDRLNVYGGAIALGHPIGCSGARILTTLVYALRERELRRGIAALCLGGGGAVAVSIETE